MAIESYKRTKIYIVLELEDSELASNLSKVEGCSIVRTDRLDGTTATQLFVELTPIIVTGLISVVLASLRAKKHVVIKKDGVEIRGIDEKSAEKLIKDLLNDK